LLRFLSLLGGRGVTLLFVGVFLGLAVPGLAVLLRPLLATSVVLLLFFSLLRVDWLSILGHLKRPLLTTLLVAWMLLGSPVLTWVLSSNLPIPQSLTTAVILMAAAPPILGSTAIALLLGLDGALALVVGLISTMLAPLTIPPLAFWLLNLELEVGTWELMLRLSAIVVPALIGALIVRRWLGREWLRTNAVAIDGTIVLVMLIFAIGVMDGVTLTMIERPGIVALWLFVSFIANPALQMVTILIFWSLGRRLAFTAGLLAGNCNMGLLLAALPASADYDVVLYFAIAQIPMYVLPALTKPIYRRLLVQMHSAT
jgi:BASS family bile acid:Na+ symporter